MNFDFNHIELNDNSKNEDELIICNDEDFDFIPTNFKIPKIDFDKQIKEIDDALSLKKRILKYNKHTYTLNITEVSLSKHMRVSDTALTLSLFSACFPLVSQLSKQETANNGVKISGKFFPMSKFILLQNHFIAVLVGALKEDEFYILTGFTFEEFKRYMPARLRNMEIQKSNSVKNFMQYFI